MEPVCPLLADFVGFPNPRCISGIALFADLNVLFGASSVHLLDLEVELRLYLTPSI